jgi:hypothetical protein
MNGFFLTTTEIAEFGVSYNRKLFSLRSLRLGGAISKPWLTHKPEEPQFSMVGLETGNPKLET